MHNAGGGPHPPMLQKQLTGVAVSGSGQQSWPGVSGTATGVPDGTWGLSAAHPMQPSMHHQPAPSYSADGVRAYQRSGGSIRHHQPNAAYPSPFYKQNLAGGPGPGMVGPHYRPPYTSLPSGTPDYQPPPGALSAAAMVAAQATASAGTTTSANVMMQPDQTLPPHAQPLATGLHPSQMHPQYVPPYDGSQVNMRMVTPSNGAMMMNREMMSAGGPMPSHHSLSYRRPSPYSNPHHMMVQQRRLPYPSAAGVPTVGMPATAPGIGPNHQQMSQMAPQQQAVYGQQMVAQMHSRPSHMMVPSGPSTRAPPPYMASAYGPPMSRNVQHPAAPLAPSYQNRYNSPPNTGNQPDVKPMSLPYGTDLLMTFPVRDGIILPPFKLEHNHPVTHHLFYLKENFYQTLIDKPDLELQLKCYHHDDKNQACNWPTSVSVQLNGRPLPMEVRDERTYNKPYYLKSACVPGKNTVTLTACACCCSHLFMLQIVQRRTVRSVKHALVNKNLLLKDKCIDKIKRSFANGVSGSGPNSADIDGVEQMSMKLSLKCPITFRRISVPARGVECSHPQCFDLESYLEMNIDRNNWKCPVCNKNAMVDSLEVDQYIWGIIEQLCKTNVDDISIDANAAWKPSGGTAVNVKDEDSKDISQSNKWVKVYSPASTNLPSAGSYDGSHHNPMSPYPTPPNSHNSQGSNSMTHYNGGVYDIGFNSPPDFTGPMSNRSDISDNDKRIVMLHRQKSGISSPQGQPSTTPNALPGANPYSIPGGPGSVPANPANIPITQNTGSTLQGPPSNAPLSQGPPSNAPPSPRGPLSNTPASNQSNSAANNLSAELSADFPDIVNSSSGGDNPLEALDDQDLLAYLGPQESEDGNDNAFNSSATADPYDIFEILSGS